jgi:ribonucrease Y
MEIVVAALGALALGVGVGFGIRRSMASRDVASAESRARRLVTDAEREAEETVRNALLEVKEEIAGMRREAEEDIRSRREESQRREARLAKREEDLDSKLVELEGGRRSLNERTTKLDRLRDELSRAQDEHRRRLEQVARMTTQEAKDDLIAQLTDQAKREAMGTVREIEQRAREEADERARKIVTIAIQRVASEQTAESTVSVFTLPSDDLKGRIIGREGRNIRAFEALTGVNLIIDDTPEAVVLSSFDPVRREVARLTLDKLVQDGRIHPARIEEMFERSSREVEEQVKRAGEWAIGEVGITEIHPEMVRVLGRLQFRTSYGQNIGKALTHEVEGSHALIGAELARRLKEPPEVVHAIESHHGEVEQRTIEAVLAQAADAISGSRPGARRESIEQYVKRLQRLEEICESHPGVSKVFAMQAGREVRVMVKPEEVDDLASQVLARDIAKQVEEELQYPGQIKITVVRETRAVEVAK